MNCSKVRLAFPSWLLAHIALILVTFTWGGEFADAQCSMCKAVLESNMQSGEQATGKGINDGIIYIMFVPYILLATVGYFMYRHYKRTNSLETE